MESKFGVLLVVAMFVMWGMAEQLNGPCPRNHRIAEKIDWQMMRERWFVIKQSDPPKSNDTKCSQTQFDFALPYLNFTYIKHIPSNGVYEKIQGNGLLRDTGRLSMFVQKEDETWNDVLFEVLDTDYYNFAVIYFCRNVEPFSSYQGSFVLSRTLTLDNGFYPRTDEILKANGLHTTDSFLNITQDCGRIQCNGDYGSCQPAL